MLRVHPKAGINLSVAFRGPDYKAGSVCPFSYPVLVDSHFHRGNCDKAAFGERFEFRAENREELFYFFFRINYLDHNRELFRKFPEL